MKLLLAAPFVTFPLPDCIFLPASSLSPQVRDLSLLLAFWTLSHMPSHYQFFRGAGALTFSSGLGCGSKIPLRTCLQPRDPSSVALGTIAPCYLEFEHRNLTVCHISSLGLVSLYFPEASHWAHTRSILAHVDMQWAGSLSGFSYSIEKNGQCPCNINKAVQRKKLCECQMLLAIRSCVIDEQV